MRERRTGLGMSQEVFADSITLHRAYYSKVEQGRRMQTTCRVTQALGVKPSQFLREGGALRASGAVSRSLSQG
ncbi:MAG: helix-turn-helix domain-containing protein [Dokdonella sp.]|uniref:helix-turn-helix domain-containing protein n=1 Tax=Dokdonella sp. TaxID=2291710 RepID=UPI003F7EB6CF